MQTRIKKWLIIERKVKVKFDACFSVVNSSSEMNTQKVNNLKSSGFKFFAHTNKILKIGTKDVVLPKKKIKRNY